MKDLKESLKLAQERVNSYLENYFSASENVAPKLYEAMRYGVLLGGKRVRPFLVYNVAKMLNGDEELADRIIRNTYKTLLSRGQKGCYIFCEDEALSNYLKMRLSKVRNMEVK